MTNIDRRWSQNLHRLNTNAISVGQIRKTLDQLQPKQDILSSFIN